MKRIRIGKSSINEVVITNDNTVSRSHAELVINKNEAVIIDLGSTNGTFVNGNRISGEYKLKELDIVRIGKHPFNWSRYINIEDYENQFPEDSKYTIVEDNQVKEKDENPKKPDNYLVESILATIFCCMPLGVVGIVFAAQVNSLYNSGDFEGANQASAKAQSWTKSSFWVGIVIGALYFFGAIAAGV